jgi:hypothetical protein
MDKSPLATLTLEDFLESERHKLTGTLTPVTPESFAKWKKDRMDKKAAEAEAMKAKEATGRAMFESGDWKDSEDEDSDEDEEDGTDNEGAWNLEAMRRETERLRQLKEEERLAQANGESVPDRNDDTNSNDAESQEGGDDGDTDTDNVAGPSGTNGTNGESSGMRDED